MNPNGHWAIGLVLAIAANLVALLLAGLVALLSDAVPDLEWLFLVFLGAPGLTQMLTVVPLAIWLWGKGHKQTVWGLLITAGIVLLLNTACWGVMGLGLLGAATPPLPPPSGSADAAVAPLR